MIASQSIEELCIPAARRQYSTYSQVKESGVDWLPRIPANWQIRRLRFDVTSPTKAEARGLPSDTAVSFVPMEAVGEYGGLNLEQIRPIGDVLNGYTYFANNDVLVAKITPCFENGKGALAVGLENEVGFGTTELHVLRAGSNLIPQFLFYMTIGEHFRKLGTSEMYGAGGQKRVPERFLKDIRHPIPPLDEQRAIVAFLDHETANIDGLIEKKLRVLRLLAQKRASTIERLVLGRTKQVTQRLHAGCWFDRLPSDWNVKRLKFVLHFLNNRRIPLSSLERGEMERNYPYYGASGIIDYVEDYLFDEPLILVAEDGANLYSRSTPLAFIASDKYWVNNHAHILRPKVGPISYWESVLQLVQYDPWITGSAQPKLTKDNLGSIPLPVPPANEMDRIAVELASCEQALAPIMASIRQAIDQLRNLRAALISTAVTGQIDVRNYRLEAPPCQ